MRPVEGYLIQHAAIARARSELQIVEAVTAARSKGLSRHRVGALLETSTQAVRQVDRIGAVSSGRMLDLKVCSICEPACS